jgi:hypothetical protein
MATIIHCDSLLAVRVEAIKTRHEGQDVKVHLGDSTRFFLTRDEAAQLAADLLNAVDAQSVGDEA